MFEQRLKEDALMWKILAAGTADCITAAVLNGEAVMFTVCVFPWNFVCLLYIHNTGYSSLGDAFLGTLYTKHFLWQYLYIRCEHRCKADSGLKTFTIKKSAL